LDNQPQYQRNPNFIFREIAEEAVLVPIHQDVANMDCIYTLNELGAYIWGLLDEPRTEQALITAVLDQYNVDIEVVRADLKRFLDEMVTIDAMRFL
jgi:hypothetical protein